MQQQQEEQQQQEQQQQQQQQQEQEQEQVLQQPKQHTRQQAPVSTTASSIGSQLPSEASGRQLPPQQELQQRLVRLVEHSIRKSSSVRNCGSLLTLLLSCLGLVVAVSSAKVDHLLLTGKLLTDNEIVWSCWGAKTAYLVAGIALVLLQLCLARGGGRIRRLARKRIQLWRRHLSCGLRLRGVQHCHFPSTFLLLTSVAFGLCSTVSSLVDAACSFVDFNASGRRRGLLLLEGARFVLFACFISAQSCFFSLHSRLLVNSSFLAAILPMSAVIGVNVACWFIAVGYEVSHVTLLSVGHSHAAGGGGNATLAATATATATSCGSWRPVLLQALYPMQIEYYVMSAVFGFLFVCNAGSRESIRGSARSKTLLQAVLKTKDPLHAFVFLGCLFAAAVVMAVLVEVLRHNVARKLVMMWFLSLLVAEHVACIGLSVTVVWPRLLRLLTCGRCATSEAADGDKFHPLPYIDKALLWLGVAAILINDLYTFGWTLADYRAAGAAANRWLLMLTCLLDICQGLLQAAILQVVLPDSKWPMLALMSMNGVAWVLYTACFPLLFFFDSDKWSEGLVISMITMPLLVFFRFHCVGCCYEAAGGFGERGRSFVRSPHCSFVQQQPLQQQQQQSSSSQSNEAE